MEVVEYAEESAKTEGLGADKQTKTKLPPAQGRRSTPTGGSPIPRAFQSSSTVVKVSNGKITAIRRQGRIWRAEFRLWRRTEQQCQQRRKNYSRTQRSQHGASIRIGRRCWA